LTLPDAIRRTQKAVEVVPLFWVIDEAIYFLEHEIDEDLRASTFHQI
jgi:hypothetical protein